MSMITVSRFKLFVLTGAAIGGMFGIMCGFMLVLDDASRECDETCVQERAAAYSSMNDPKFNGAFVDELSTDDSTFAEYSDYSELCPSHYATANVVLTRNEAGKTIMLVVGPKDVVDKLLPRITFATKAHYCEVVY